jgi:AraC-like DNA-binding protein/quercetin dioxygenase-like cupin family protein
MLKYGEKVEWAVVRERLEREKILLIHHSNLKSVKMHDHFFLELTYIIEGEAEHTLDGHMSVVKPGDYFIVDYGSRHSYKATGGEGFLNLDLLFLPEVLDPVLKGTKSLRTLLEHYLLHFNINALVQNPSRMVFHDGEGKIKKLLDLINEEAEARRPGYSELIRCYLIEILLLTMRQLDDAEAASSGQDISAFITAYVADHYMEDLTLKEIADKMNYSLPYISKRFKEDVGTTFVKYLQNYRVMQGCRLLTSSRRSLAEITEVVGYKDVKFFSALVKKMTGLSPADFRRTGGKK